MSAVMINQNVLTSLKTLKVIVGVVMNQLDEVKDKVPDGLYLSSSNVMLEMYEMQKEATREIEQQITDEINRVTPVEGQMPWRKEMSIKDHVSDIILENFDIDRAKDNEDYIEELKQGLFNGGLDASEVVKHISTEKFLTIFKETYYFYETQFGMGEDVVDALSDNKLKLFNLYALMIFGDSFDDDNSRY